MEYIRNVLKMNCIKCPTVINVSILYNGKCIDSYSEGNIQYGKTYFKCSENWLKKDLTQCLKCSKG